MNKPTADIMMNADSDSSLRDACTFYSSHPRFDDFHGVVRDTGEGELLD